MPEESVRQHRILVIAPSAKAVTIATFLNTNFGANTCPSNLGPGLSADGNEPSTHNLCCLSVTVPQGRVIMNRVFNLAGQTQITLPAWTAMTKPERKATVDGLQQAVFNNYQIYFDMADNLGQWRAMQEAIAFLAANGVTLKQIGKED